MTKAKAPRWINLQKQIWDKIKEIESRIQQLEKVLDESEGKSREP